VDVALSKDFGLTERFRLGILPSRYTSTLSLSFPLVSTMPVLVGEEAHDSLDGAPPARKSCSRTSFIAAPVKQSERILHHRDSRFFCRPQELHQVCLRLAR